MLLLEEILVVIAKRHDRRHVHLVEGGEHGRRVLRFLEPRRDRLAQARHADAFLARRLIGGCGHTQLNGCGRGCRGLRRRFQRVALRDAAVLACAFDLRGVEIVLLGDAAHGRRETLGNRRLRRNRCGLRSGRGGGFRRGGLRLFLLRGGLRRDLAGAFADRAENGADRNRLADLDRNFRQHARSRRRHFHRHLVGFELDQRLIHRHGVAGLLEPLRDRRLRHRFAECRHLDFRGHSLSAFQRKSQSTCNASDRS